MSSPAATIIVPTFGKLPRLRSTLMCLAALRQPEAGLELVIIDDGSTDGTARALAKFEPPFPLIVERRANGGRSVARNHGAARARADVLLFCDDDMLPGPDWALAHLAAVREGVVSRGRILELPQFKFHEDPVAGRLRAEFDAADLHRSRRARLRSTRLDPEQVIADFQGFCRAHTRVAGHERRVAALLARAPVGRGFVGVAGANFAVARAAFERVGGFDEALGRRWGCEDFELGYRLERSGWSVRYNSAAVAVHQTHARFDHANQHRLAMAEVLAKHGHALELRELSRYFVAGDVGFFTVHPATGAAPCE
ncbi:MAG: glycosyltransferase [Enhygromyxa sp.]